MTLTAVSLFAGVAGIDHAMSRAGIDVVAAVEIDSAARGVIADHYPHVTLFGDIREVTGDQLRAAGFVPERGIITAGFPCQDLSVAGRRQGMGEGTRSGLYWHVDRLLAELTPAWVLLENVDGLLSATCPCPGDGLCTANGRQDNCGHYVKKQWRAYEPHTVTGGVCAGGCIPTHGGALGAVLGSVAQRGYGFAYRVLDAQHFGVPQRRARVIIVGHLGDPAGPAQVLLEPEISSGDPAQGDPARPGVAATLTAGTAGPGIAAPGRRQEDDVNLVVSTLQGGGRRGYRVDAEAAAGGHLIPISGERVDQ